MLAGGAQKQSNRISQRYTSGHAAKGSWGLWFHLTKCNMNGIMKALELFRQAIQLFANSTKIFCSHFLPAPILS